MFISPLGFTSDLVGSNWNMLHWDRGITSLSVLVYQRTYQVVVRACIGYKYPINRIKR